MAASNLTNNLKIFAENTVNKQTDTQFANEDQRDLGYAPNTVISSKVMNTALRQATLVSVALIEALKQLSVDDLVNPITFGSNTSVSDAKDAIVDAINKIKIPEATLADNVQPGTIVSDSMTSRKYKHGWQISQDLKKKLTFKSNWVGQHINNDVLYFGTTGILKGYYLVHGLTNESVNEGNGAVTEAGKLTITAGQTPATGAISGNLKRLTFETELGSDTALSKVTSISGSSTDNQIPSAKAVWNALEDVEGGMDAHSGRTDNPHAVTKAQVGLSNVTNDKQLKDSDKTTSIDNNSTDVQIPSAKAAYTAINTVATNLSTHVGKTDNPHAVTKAQVGLSAVDNYKQLRDSDKVTTIGSSSTNTNIPSAKAVYDFITNGVDATLDSHIGNTNNPHGVTKSQVGLGSVTNHAQLKVSDKVTSIGTSPTNDQIPSAAAVKSYADTKLTAAQLIGTYTNTQTINKSALTGYKFLVFELKKLTTGYNGNFYGDSVMVTPDIFYYYYNAGSEKYWKTTVAGGTSFNPDLTMPLIDTSSDFVNYLYANYPAAGYPLGQWARNAYSESLPIEYVYAQVAQDTPPFTQKGGIRLAQFDGTNLTYATVVSISSTQIRLNCDSTYNLRVWGFN